MNRIEETTSTVIRMRDGDRAAAEVLLPTVYDELRAIAEACFRFQRANHTLQPTALVHEVYLKLVDHGQAEWQGRAHFFAVAARAMRQILVDHARGRKAAKRGGGWKRITIHDANVPEALSQLDVLALDEALTRLCEIDARQAAVVEMRFFAGLKVEEAAEALGVSPRTVELDWQMAKAWLSRALSGGPP